MEKRLVDPHYTFRPPKPHPFWRQMLRPIQQHVLRRRYQVTEVEIRGAEHLADATAGGTHSAMITPNHPAHGDPFVICDTLHRSRVPCCFMASWHVFMGAFGLKGWAFQRLGAFSVDREGTDLRSFRTAVDLLTEGSDSLVIFPEGEVYHLNDVVTPPREGAAMIALTAARRRAKANAQPLHIVPCAIKYFYLEDPTPELLNVMTALEQRIHWRPLTHLTLPERIYRYAGAMLALKELEYLHEVQSGSIPPRITGLAESIMSGIETRRMGAVHSDETLPVRVKNARVKVLKELGLDPSAEKTESGEVAAPPPLPAQIIEQAQRDLNDMHLVMQLFSYPGDYVAQSPTIERLTETIDKFEEDAMGRLYAGARAPRKAIVTFGEPMNVSEYAGAGAGGSGVKMAARDAAGHITETLQQKMQALVDEATRRNR